MIVMLSVLGCLSLWAALNTAIENAPDEVMRLILAKYIYRAGRLPIGNEEEVISAAWGFSYAYTPYFPQMIAAVIMKIVSLFTASKRAIFVAFRMVNVAGYIVTGVYSFIC